MNLTEQAFNETFVRIRKIINMQLGGQESLLTPESLLRGTGPNDCGMNETLYVLTLCEHLKAEFEHEIPLENLMDILTIRDLVNYFNALAGIEVN